MRLQAHSDQILAATVDERIQTLRLKSDITLEVLAKNAAASIVEAKLFSQLILWFLINFFLSHPPPTSAGPDAE